MIPFHVPCPLTSSVGSPEDGMIVCKIGGPAYRIGMGGGAASSRYVRVCVFVHTRVYVHLHLCSWPCIRSCVYIGGIYSTFLQLRIRQLHYLPLFSCLLSFSPPCAFHSFSSLPFPYCFYFYLATPFSPIPFHSPSSPLLFPLSSFFFLMVSSKMSFLSIHAYLSTFHCIPLLLYTFIRP